MTAPRLTTQQQAEASTELLQQLSSGGAYPADIISVLVITLQMAICYGAKSKEDAIKMINSIAADSVRVIPQQYDLVQRGIDDAGRPPVRH
jgi:hypothetical protein